MAKQVINTVHAWNSHPNGAAACGPCRPIATDGEAMMRLCQYTLCMSHKLLASILLHSLLQNPSSLNLFIGVGDMMCDPKHIIKCAFTLHSIVAVG